MKLVQHERLHVDELARDRRPQPVLPINTALEINTKHSDRVVFGRNGPPTLEDEAMRRHIIISGFSLALAFGSAADALAQQSNGNANGTGGAYGAGSTGGSTLGTGSGAGGVRNSGESDAKPTLGTGSGAGGVTSPASSGTATGAGSSQGAGGDAAPR